MQKIRLIFISLRPKQWIKNLFVFAPLLFSGGMFDVTAGLASLQCFFYFSLASSAIYLINDVIDRRADRLHPLKSKRPIANNLISPSLTLGISFLLMVFVLMVAPNRFLFAIIVAYIVLNIAYSLFLKDKLIVDAICIALGFELRIWAGAVAIGMQPSGWLQACTFPLALFIGFAKRKEEVLYWYQLSGSCSPVRSAYQRGFINQLIVICAALTILTYLFYTLSPGLLHRHNGKYMIYTVFFVVYGIFRYMYLINMHKGYGDPTEIITSDIPLAANLFLWLFATVIILYL